jgi:hypothetical protein
LKSKTRSSQIISTFFRNIKQLENKHRKKENEHWRLDVLEKLSNNQRKNTRKKKSSKGYN